MLELIHGWFYFGICFLLVTLTIQNHSCVRGFASSDCAFLVCWDPKRLSVSGGSMVAVDGSAPGDGSKAGGPSGLRQEMRRGASTAVGQVSRSSPSIW